MKNIYLFLLIFSLIIFYYRNELLSILNKNEISFDKNIVLIIIIVLLICLYISMNKKKKLPKISLKNKNLFMCYHDKSKIPQKVYDNLEKYASNYNVIIYDDKEIIQFFKDHYKDSDRYINKFNKLQGAHKADLWRYCVLYNYGGVYLDIKTELIKPLNKIFTDDNMLYTVLSINNGTLYQGIISSPPKNPIFLDLIEYILNIGKNYNYLIFTKNFYDKIKDYCGDVKVGLNKNIKNDIDIYLFTEGCSKDNANINKSNLWNINEEKLKKGKCISPDKYGLCCYIYHNNFPIIKVRYDDFGIKW